MSIEQVFRDEWARVVGALLRQFGDLDIAEEAAQEAFVAAAERWPRDGSPDNPGAWLVTTARNRALDRIRRSRVLADKLELLAARSAAAPPGPETGGVAAPADVRLLLLLMCCHPALALEAQVALTLRAVGGLTTAEIARAFLVPHDTMKRRLTRARSRLVAHGVRFEQVAAGEVPERLAAVRAVVYLVFNEGHQARWELADEAIHLGRVLLAATPHDPESAGLLALMLLHDARREARRHDGEVVLLAEQDRASWNHPQAAEGRRLLAAAEAWSGGEPGPYTLQARIAAHQMEDHIDWTAVAELYAELADLTGSDVVRLNRAVAVAEAGDPGTALRLLEPLDLGGYRYFHSTRAELLRRLGDTAAARGAFEAALALTDDEAERRFLLGRIAGC